MSEVLRGVVVSHSAVAQALVAAVDAIAGLGDALVPVSNEGCDREALRERLAAAIGAGPAVLFVDLPGGSCLTTALRFARDHPGLAIVTGVNLAISLNAPDDGVRERIMPVNRKFPLAELIPACEYYQQKKGRMITLEYILIAGVNDGPDQTRPLAELARRLTAADGILPGARVAVFAAPEEGDQAAAVLRAVPESRRIDMVGQAPLPVIGACLRRCAFFVGNDSGLMHVAAATGRPIVVIYGSTTPAYTPPLTDTARLLYLDIACSPCRQRTCRYGHYRCLKEISVQGVMEEIRNLMGRSAIH